MAEIDKNIANDMAGQEGTGTKIPKEVSRTGIIESIKTTTQEMATIATLKEAIADYLQLEDIYEYDDNTSYYCLILGRLEISLIQRKQSLDSDRQALLELEE